MGELEHGTTISKSEKLIELANTELKIASDWFKANKLLVETLKKLF